MAALVLAAPARATNPDEPPARTRSGKVVPSRDPAPPGYGPKSGTAKVRVIVFSDFQCPVCSRITGATHQIAEEWPGQVQLEFRQMPLVSHGNAENTAVAALAAHRQGKFWAMHDVLFAHQNALDPDSLARWAREAGLDAKRWAKDYADPALRERVRKERALAERLGAEDTPTFFIDGKMSSGWASWEAFRSQVEAELKAVDALLAKGVKPAEVHARRAREAIADDGAFDAYVAAIIAPPAKAKGATPARSKKAAP
jgi:protein-disulfide isomerase